MDFLYFYAQSLQRRQISQQVSGGIRMGPLCVKTQAAKALYLKAVERQRGGISGLNCSNWRRGGRGAKPRL